MALQIQGNNGTLIEVGGPAFRAGHVHLKPLEYGALGHYRMAVDVLLLPSQAANSRLFEIRNSHVSNLLIPTRLTARVMPIGGVATPYLFELGCFRCTSFSDVDTASATAAIPAPMKSSMAGSPGSAQVRYLQAAGHASGMTGGTMTKATLPWASLMAWMASVSSTTQPVTMDWFRHPDEHPPILTQDQGLIIENIKAGPATQNAVLVQIELAWAEVTAY